MVKIIHEREKCIGCGSCVSVCSENFEMGDDGKSKLKGAEEKEGKFEKEMDDAGCCKEAAEACPVKCIKVE